MTAFPRWTWADTDAMRVEVDPDVFVDYVRRGGVWRQKTGPMSAAESVTPERHWLNDWRTPVSEWPAVDPDMGVWLDGTYEQIGVRS